MATLEHLVRVDRSEVWAREDSDFTPWLCLDENLALLSETIQIDLEFVKREFAVGNYRLDILAKHAESDEMVVIENQFGSTDHWHLGQIMTYAAGVGSDGSGARTIIWIAENFNEPHRSALDWLNKCTEPGIRFFGIEFQLWRIGNSAPAPRFNIVSKPNDWQKIVTHQSSALTATEQLYLDFWAEFIRLCESTNSPLNLPNAWARHWLPTFIGRSYFTVNLTVSKKFQKLECQLWIEGTKAKEAFALLNENRVHIVEELGLQIEFDSMIGKKSCKIFEAKEGDVADRAQWPTLHSWLKERGEAYARVFTPLIRQLKLAE